MILSDLLISRHHPRAADSIPEFLLESNTKLQTNTQNMASQAKRSNDNPLSKVAKST